jgi:hypothetical protein
MDGNAGTGFGMSFVCVRSFVVTVLAELLMDRTRYTFLEWRNSTNTGERKETPKRFVKVESFF